jgi:tetratricopeptide (TPR) repeat protein
MSQPNDFSKTDYQQALSLSAAERLQRIEDESTPADLKALLLYQQGRHLANGQQFEAAIADYTQAINLKPNYYPAWSDRAAALKQVGRYQEAVESCDRALELNPQDFQLWYQRGMTLRRLGDFEAAIASFDQALMLNPYFYPVTRSRLYALLTTGKIFSHLLGNCTPRDRDRLWHDLSQTLIVFTQRKLPALVVIGLAALFSTHSQTTALIVAAIFAGVALWGELIQEAEK